MGTTLRYNEEESKEEIVQGKADKAFNLHYSESQVF